MRTVEPVVPSTSLFWRRWFWILAIRAIDTYDRSTSIIRALKMFEWVKKYGLRLADSTITNKQTVLIVLFVSYIWDLVRREYVDSRKKEYEEYYRQMNERPEIHSRDRGYQSFSCERGAQYRLPVHNQTVRHYSLTDQKVLNNESIKRELNNLLDREFDCPIPPMSKFLKRYRTFSTAFAIYAAIKYTILCAVYYRWIDVDKSYACYLPGRLSILPDEGVVYELPWMGAAIFMSHLIWRAMWRFSHPIEVDALLFLCYDKDAVLDKQYQVLELNDPSISSTDDAYRKYLCNRLFYQRRIDARGRTVYTMKENRTVEHYEQLDRLMVGLRLYYPYFLYPGYLLLAILSFCTYFRHDYFDMSYPSCRSFSSSVDDENFEWSFSDKFRLFYLFFDLLDGFIFILDTTLGLTIPFGVNTITTHDLCLRFDALRKRIRRLNEKFRSSSIVRELSMEMGTATVTHSTMKYIECLQEKSDLIFNETIGTFEQVKRVDDYIRKSSSFTFYSWFIANSSYQASSILNLIPKGGVVSLVNMIMTIITYQGVFATFIISARPHHRARLLYNELSTAMALCPTIPKTKIAWRWLLEYYKDHTKYSLHLIGNYALSNLNILRSASWIVTCVVVLFSLLKH